MSAKLEAASKYVLAIRNVDKREYGIRYLDELRGRARVSERDFPSLSHNVTQAVRKRLHEIWYAEQV